MDRCVQTKDIASVTNYINTHTISELETAISDSIIKNMPELYKPFLPLILGMTNADPSKRIDIDTAYTMYDQCASIVSSE